MDGATGRAGDPRRVLADASRPPEPLELNRRPDRVAQSDVRVGHSSSTSTRRAFVREGPASALR